MAHIDSKGSDLDVDLENGGTTSEEDGSKDSCSSDEHAKKLFGKVWSGLEGLDGTRGVDGLSSYNKSLNSGGISVGNLQILSDKLGKEREDFVEKKLVKDKWNKMASKMPRKPPRPPRDPSLDSADMMLVREITELTMLKRKRIERIKALKKMKAENTPSFNSNLFAMMITVLFCFVIIFQGMCFRNSSTVSLNRSPEAELAANGGMIPVAYFNNLSPSETSGPGSEFSKYVDP